MCGIKMKLVRCPKVENCTWQVCVHNKPHERNSGCYVDFCTPRAIYGCACAAKEDTIIIEIDDGLFEL
jgi:hypothetical protein